jgi:hypothetical protein
VSSGLDYELVTVKMSGGRPAAGSMADVPARRSAHGASPLSPSISPSFAGVPGAARYPLCHYILVVLASHEAAKPGGGLVSFLAMPGRTV